MQLGLELPAQLRRLLTILDRDGVGLHLPANELEPLVARAGRVGDRLVASLLLAALIGGLAELIAADP